MKSKTHELGTTQITAGTTKESRSVVIQRVDGEPCIVLHKCRVESGLHLTKADGESYVDAIPLSNIIYLLNMYPRLAEDI